MIIYYKHNLLYYFAKENFTFLKLSENSFIGKLFTLGNEKTRALLKEVLVFIDYRIVNSK